MKKLALICLAFLGLTACSRLDIAFRWVDVFIAGKVDDYFDINSQQKKELKKSVQKDLKQIQAKLLPQWIENFKEIGREIDAGPIEEQKVATYFSSFMTDVEGIKGYFSDTAMRFVASVDDSQIQYFKKSFAKKNAEDLDKAKDAEKVREEYRDKYEDYFGMFVGSLTKEQEKLLDKHLQTSCFPAELKAKNNEHLFETFLKEGDTKEKRRQFVKDLYDHPDRYDLPDYKKAMGEYQVGLKSLITEVMTTLTPDQKVKLKKNLAEKTAQLEKAGTYIQSL